MKVICHHFVPEISSAAMWMRKSPKLQTSLGVLRAATCFHNRYIYIYLPIYLPTHLTNLSIYLSIYLSIIYLSIYLWWCTYLCIILLYRKISIYLPGCIYPLYWAINQSIYLPIYMYLILIHSRPWILKYFRIRLSPMYCCLKNISSKAIAMVPLSYYILGRAVPLIYIYIYTHMYVYMYIYIEIWGQNCKGYIPTWEFKTILYHTQPTISFTSAAPRRMGRP